MSGFLAPVRTDSAPSSVLDSLNGREAAVGTPSPRAGSGSPFGHTSSMAGQEAAASERSESFRLNLSSINEALFSCRGELALWSNVYCTCTVY